MRQRTIYSEDYKLLLGMLRAARGDTPQATIAGRLRMTQSIFSKYERGELRMDVIQLRAWCKALQIDFLQFVTDFTKRTG